MKLCIEVTWAGEDEACLIAADLQRATGVQAKAEGFHVTASVPPEKVNHVKVFLTRHGYGFGCLSDD